MIGRSGLFRYNNQDHALQMGILAGRNLTDRNRAHDVEEIGAEAAYLERGTHEGVER
jgi:hypothetical protein